MTLSLCAACSSTPKMTDTEDTATTASSESGQETALSSGEENSTSTDTTGELPTCAGDDDDTRLIFVTSWSFTGDLQTTTDGVVPNIIGEKFGLARADALCQHLAEMALLEGYFMAWLSDETTGAAERLVSLAGFSGVFKNLKGETIAEGWSKLVTAGAQNPVMYDESGDEVMGVAVWTNTNVEGKPALEHCCENWTKKAPSNSHAVLGCADAPGEDWTQSPFLGHCAGGPIFTAFRCNS